MNQLYPMPYEQWADEFNPWTNGTETDESDFYETVGEDMRFVEFMFNHYPQHVWTIIEGDLTEDRYIVNGLHHVNTLGFCITEKPAQENVEYEVIDN